MPIAAYDKQTAQDIAAKLKGLTKRELLMIAADEATHVNRATITDTIAKSTSSLAGWLGRRDGGLVVRFLCADVCSLISGRVWAVAGRREM